MKLEISRQIFEKSSNIGFHEIPSSGSRIVTCGQTGMTKLTVAVRNFANVPKTNTHNYTSSGYVHTSTLRYVSRCRIRQHVRRVLSATNVTSCSTPCSVCRRAVRHLYTNPFKVQWLFYVLPRLILKNSTFSLLDANCSPISTIQVKHKNSYTSNPLKFNQCHITRWPLHSANGAYLFFVRFSEQTAIISLRNLKSSNFITNTRERVNQAVRTELLNRNSG
jgi:hypothetical protein